MSRRIEHRERTTSRVGLWQLLDTVMREHRGSDDLDAPGLSDSIAFAHDTRTDYPPTDVSHCATDPDRAVTISSPFLGLAGTGSALPMDVTESVLGADDGGATADFFDVIHARVMEVVHAAWRTFGPNGADTLRQGLRSFMGDDAFFAEAPPTPPEELFGLGLSDVVRCNPEHLDIAGFELLLSRVFPDLGVRVSIGAPVFVETSAAEKAPLGLGPNILGGGMTYGRGTWNPVGTLRITTQTVADAAALLPGGAAYERLAELAAAWMPRCREIELDVPLAGEQASWTRLGARTGARLSFDAQITRHKPDKVRMRVKIVTASNRVAVRYVADE